ncbi:methyltransferase domain-containing protein [Amycolatopsis thermophila]|uniref:SAM-dependent methyltransferase n=1 Tax=Amycolatopsis thermophila TaxID=206084 RepID=A0ABU0ES18_9PSEU|nr:methyltransferase domain-containing protein [Amycolatopsis thermophila]MDQ0378093.1 SAM-dependent methyltransferase [Amycolatopsis thermophila]
MSDLVAEIIRNAADHSALSDELHFAALAPAERDQLDHGRANVLRALRLPPGARVLEVGAGYGAVTRYLGERVARVDAIEPDPARAEAVAARTADLPGVRVLDAVPDESYDLVVAPGAQHANRLEPGGVLCLAVPNRLGVNRPGGQSRRAWERELSAAGLTVHKVLGCLPDHRVTRAVFTPELLEEHPRLAIELAGRDERWAELVEGGLGLDTVDGLLFLASNGEPAARLWPDGVLATYFNTDRAARWCTRADVVGDEIRRTPLLPQEPGPVTVREWTDVVVDAPTLPEVLAEQPWRAAELLTAWADLVRAGVSWDLVPANVLVAGELRAIDLEWERAGTTADEVLDRGLLLLADQLAARGWTGAAPGTSVRDLAAWLGVLLGRPAGFVEAAAEREAEFQAIRRCGTTAGPGLDHERDAMRLAWRRRLAEETGHRPAGPTELDARVARTMARVDRIIAPGDSMFRGNTEHYFAVAGQALRACLHGLEAAGRPAPQRVLDFGCGYGRVLRAFRVAFPAAELIASDIELDGVDHCVRFFGATGLPASVRIDEIPQVSDIDLIWSGSVLTHLDIEAWDALLGYFERALAPGGVAVVTTHGRRVAWRMANGGEYGLTAEDHDRVLADYRSRGFGYADYPGQPGYGISLSTPAWVTGHVLTARLRLAGYIEAGWDGHQDVLILVKDAEETLKAGR